MRNETMAPGQVSGRSTFRIVPNSTQGFRIILQEDINKTVSNGNVELINNTMVVTTDGMMDDNFRQQNTVFLMMFTIIPFTDITTCVTEGLNEILDTVVLNLDTFPVANQAETSVSVIHAQAIVNETTIGNRQITMPLNRWTPTRTTAKLFEDTMDIDIGVTAVQHPQLLLGIVSQKVKRASPEIMRLAGKILMFKTPIISKSFLSRRTNGKNVDNALKAINVLKEYRLIIEKDEYLANQTKFCKSYLKCLASEEQSEIEFGLTLSEFGIKNINDYYDTFKRIDTCTKTYITRDCLAVLRSPLYAKYVKEIDETMLKSPKPRKISTANRLSSNNKENNDPAFIKNPYSLDHSDEYELNEDSNQNSLVTEKQPSQENVATKEPSTKQHFLFKFAQSSTLKSVVQFDDKDEVRLLSNCFICYFNEHHYDPVTKDCLDALKCYHASRIVESSLTQTESQIDDIFAKCLYPFIYALNIYNQRFEVIEHELIRLKGEITGNYYLENIFEQFCNLSTNTNEKRQQTSLFYIEHIHAQFQRHGYFEIRPCAPDEIVKNGYDKYSYGVYAKRNIEPGTLLLVEQAFSLVDVYSLKYYLDNEIPLSLNLTEASKQQTPSSLFSGISIN
ncbi:unnamed protein product, partial [Didymodactylos carnosus]